MVEGQELLKVTVSLRCRFSSDISPPHAGLQVYIWFRPEIPPVHWTQQEQWSS